MLSFRYKKEIDETWMPLKRSCNDMLVKLKNLLGDSMLRTLRSDTKINILNPNLDVKMFIKGVQTYLEIFLVFPLYLIKRCFG